MSYLVLKKGKKRSHSKWVFLWVFVHLFIYLLCLGRYVGACLSQSTGTTSISFVVITGHL